LTGAPRARCREHPGQRTAARDARHNVTRHIPPRALRVRDPRTDTRPPRHEDSSSPPAAPRTFLTWSEPSRVCDSRVRWIRDHTSSQRCRLPGNGVIGARSSSPVLSVKTVTVVSGAASQREQTSTAPTSGETATRRCHNTRPSSTSSCRCAGAPLASIRSCPPPRPDPRPRPRPSCRPHLREGGVVVRSTVGTRRPRRCGWASRRTGRAVRFGAASRWGPPPPRRAVDQASRTRVGASAVPAVSGSDEDPDDLTPTTSSPGWWSACATSRQRRRRERSRRCGASRSRGTRRGLARRRGAVTRLCGGSRGSFGDARRRGAVGIVRGDARGSFGDSA